MSKLQHRVDAATNVLECARAALKANPGNISFALDVQKAQMNREAAIMELRRSFAAV